MHRSALAIFAIIVSMANFSSYASAGCTNEQRLALLKYYSVAQVEQLCGDSNAPFTAHCTTDQRLSMLKYYTLATVAQRCGDSDLTPQSQLSPPPTFAKLCVTNNGQCQMAAQMLPESACTCYFLSGPAFGVSR
jgi:hypothetical protein